MSNYCNDKELMEEIKVACNNVTNMREAFDKMTRNINYITFLKYSKKLGVFIKAKNICRESTSLEDILHNKYYCNSYKLKNKLIKKGYKEKKCEKCGLTHWRGREISLELHHKDGNTRNNELENLEILCLNCHAQTDNYRSRRKE